MPTLLIDFAAGCIGGAAGVLAGHPLDTVKVRLQTQTTAQYTGSWHCFRAIVRHEPPSTLYRGLSSPLASVPLVNSLVFGVYGAVIGHNDDGRRSLSTHFVAGCAAGFAQSFITAPCELLKLRLQTNTCTQFRSPIECAKWIVQTNGNMAIFRGMLATLSRDCPAFGIYFASYEYMARRMSKDGQMETLTSVQLLLAGGAAGMFSWLFNYPTDVIKTRFQAVDSYSSYWDCIRKTYSRNGYRTFTVGLTSTLLRAFPTNAATFFTVEWTYRILIDAKFIRNSAIDLDDGDCSHSNVTNNVLWSTNCFILPEAGSTCIDPIVHGFRFY